MERGGKEREGREGGERGEGEGKERGRKGERRGREERGGRGEGKGKGRGGEGEEAKGRVLWEKKGQYKGSDMKKDMR